MKKQKEINWKRMFFITLIYSILMFSSVSASIFTYGGTDSGSGSDNFFNLTIISNISWEQVTNGTLWLANNVTYAYALNDSRWSNNYTNFTRIYANVTDYNTSWSSITNTSYLLTTNVTYAYALNDSRWTLNYSNMSIGWLYAVNSSGSGSDSFIANFTNFTRMYSNITLYNTSWGSITNTSYARLDANNVFGAFDQTFDTNTLYVDESSNNVGIGVTTHSQKLQVVGGTSQAGFFNSSTGIGITFDVQTTPNVTALYSDWLSGVEPNIHIATFSQRAGPGGLTIRKGGNVGVNSNVPQNTLNVVGDINGTAKFYAKGLSVSTGTPSAVCVQSDGEITNNSGVASCLVSSAKYKKNIQPLSLSINQFMQLDPVTFQYVSGDQRQRIGFTAENIQAILPNAVVLEPSKIYQTTYQIVPKTIEINNVSQIVSENLSVVSLVDNPFANTPRSYDSSELLAFTIKIVQDQQLQINQLRASMCKNGDLEYC